MKALLKHGIVAVSVSTVLLTGCMSTTKVENKVDVISNPSYIVAIPESQYMPSQKEMMGAQKSVVVLPVKIDSNANFETGAVRQISSDLENGLIEVGVEIVDRSLASKLGDEILAYEATGQFSGSGIDVADVAILPAIHNVGITKSFSPASSWTDDDGKRHRTPASCRYTASVTGNVKFFELPDVAETEALNFEGDASTSLDISNSSCPVSQDIAYSLASQASGNGVFSILTKIKQNFSLTGYVVEYRRREDLHLVKITMGKAQKLKEGQAIKFSTKFAQMDHTTGKNTFTHLEYDFDGVVSDMIETNSAWVIVDEEAEAQLKKGDIAKTHFEDSILDQFIRAGSTGSTGTLMQGLKNSFN